MFVQKEYKEGVIYSKKGIIYTKIQFALASQDEKVYEALKLIKNVLLDQDAQIKINYTRDKIIDEKPPAEQPQKTDKKTIDYPLTLEKYKYIIDNMIFKDEDIYGKNLDGQNAEYRMIWKNNSGKEYFVPLDGIDSFKAENPNGAYSYNSETHQISFNTISAQNVDYILRRYITDVNTSE